MGGVSDLQVNEHEATQQAIVEYQVNPEMLVIECEAILPRLKEKALAEFEEKMLNPADDGCFQVALSAQFGWAAGLNHPIVQTSSEPDQDSDGFPGSFYGDDDDDDDEPTE